jgi:hypothetical protein
MASPELTWHQLLQRAIRGTDRVDGQQTPRDLLFQVSKLALQRKAGFPLDRYQEELPTPVDSTDGQVCSPEATAYVHRMLNGQFRRALPEFIQWLQQTKQELPPLTLPGILDACVKDRQLWELVAPLLSGRGAWLAAQHPEWSGLLIDRPDPEMLQIGWGGLQAEEKLALIQHLPPPFGPKDLEWLKAGLEDRSGRVRAVVIKALLSLEGEVWENAALEWLEGYLGKGEEPLPEVLSDIQRKNASAMELGQEMLTMLNPTRFMERLHRSGKDPSSLPEPWRKALLTASIHYREPGLIREFVSLSVLHTEPGSRLPAQAPKAVDQISRKEFNAIALSAIQHRKDLMSEQDPLFQLLLQSHQPWEDELTRMLFAPLKEKLRIYQDSQWQHIHYRRLLEAGAYRIRPRYLSTLLADWPAMGYRQMEWIEALEIVENVVAFRIGFIEALRKTHN